MLSAKELGLPYQDKVLRYFTEMLPPRQRWKITHQYNHPVDPSALDPNQAVPLIPVYILTHSLDKTHEEYLLPPSNNEIPNIAFSPDYYPRCVEALLVAHSRLSLSYPSCFTLYEKPFQIYVNMMTAVGLGQVMIERMRAYLQPAYISTAPQHEEHVPPYGVSFPNQDVNPDAK